MDIIAQKPAEGILIVKDWGSSKMYKAVCECGNDDCTHTIDIEAEDTGIVITVYTKQRTNFWSMNRWQHIWKLLFKGYVDLETTIVLSEQTALNYSETLKTAINDVKEFRQSVSTK
jgi:hypothetical protein